MKPVALVSMPTLSAKLPSFQLGLLKPTLERAGIPVKTYSLFMYFGRHIGWHLNETLAKVWPANVGEWLWAPAAFGEFSDAAAYFKLYESNFRSICAEARTTVEHIEHLRREATFSFLDFCLKSIDWSQFGLIGLSVVFQQLAASLALARVLKEKYPHIPIILGGATFEDDIAEEIMQRCPWVSYVHCGDADASFPELVRRLDGGESPRGLRGLLWRDGARVVFEGRAPNFADMNKTPIPDFDEYFYARNESGYGAADPEREVMLPIETARGCWWGMKNHCTFCGLNRSGMEFRAKSVDGVLEMIDSLARRYDQRHFNAIDNILAPEYTDELFNKLADSRTDVRLHYEIRPSLSRAQLGRMRRGGLFSVQPGVESFSTRVLTLMKKHTTGMRNLELIKWCTYYGINNLYNILYGFPGETVDDYQSQCDVVDSIHHFQPPYAVARARPDRGSPMFHEPQAHAITLLEPSPCYRYIFPREFDLRRVSYYFEHRMANGMRDEDYEPLHRAVAAWRAGWQARPRASLTFRKSYRAIVVSDGRQVGRAPRTHALDERESRVYEFCGDAHKAAEVAPALDEDPDSVNRILDDLCARNLMIQLDGRYLSLALPENPFH